MVHYAVSDYFHIHNGNPICMRQAGPVTIPALHKEHKRGAPAGAAARTRPGTPDSGQAAKRDSLWVLDIGSSNHGGHTSPLSAPTTPRQAARPWSERMQVGEEPKVDDAIDRCKC
jgi:hypothetical protein